MKKISILASFFFLLFAGVYAQQTPQGMQYQAVARDLGGKILPNQEISLKISLVSNDDLHTVIYSEVHNVMTSQLGLFTLVIGNGKAEKGKFTDVPWSTRDIWMQVAIKDKGKKDFATISSSRLLAVPYAFHAATASQLIGSINGNGGPVLSGNQPGVPSNNWSLQGNYGSDPTKDKLGNTDSVDLVFVTNNIERLRILANGDIILKRTLTVGANLNVDSSVFLNRLGGSTISYGPFTVGTSTRRSPTVLKGSLTVDAGQPTKLGGTLSVDSATDLNASLNVDGPTDLNSTLNVNNNSATKLTGSLQVNGVTNLNSALNVNNGSPTALTGSLRVDSNATFKQYVFINNPTYNSTSTATGALVVGGGVGIGKNLNVGGDANFGGKTSFSGAVTISDLTQSFNTKTGALIVGGGVGIGKRINVGGGGFFDSTLRVTGATTLNSKLAVADSTRLGSALAVTGATTLNNTLAVTGATTLSSTAAIAGVVSVTNATPSTSTATGAVVVTGGLGVGQNVNIGGTLTTTGATTLNGALAANGQVTITANPPGGESSYGGYPLRVQGGTEGIAVKVTGSRNSSNNFVSFWDDNGIQGRIEGQTLSELHDDADYKSELASRIYDVTSGTIDLIFATTDLAEAISDQVSADASVNVCAGLGVVACPPIISLIAGSVVNLALAVAQEVVVVADVVFSSVNLADFIKRKDDAVGVSYQSGAGDYAEYLMKENGSERISAGDIVGLKGGKISKNTEGAERVMVISSKPIVLGNLPQPGTEGAYEKVAFMGQVPVKVFGNVNLGDYIVANEANNGIGIAIAREKITPKDIKNIVGVAWSTAKNGFQFSTVNVAVGLNVNDNQKLIEDQQLQIDDLKNQMAATFTQLEKLVPGFKASMANATDDSKPAYMVNKKQTPFHQQQFTTTANNVARTEVAKEVRPVSVSGNPDITYNEMTKNDLIRGFELAEKTQVSNGDDISKSPFWTKFKSDPSYKEATLNRIMSQYKIALQHQKDLDGKLMR